MHAKNNVPDEISSLLRLAIVQAWECTLGARKVVYLSGPITTGRLLVKAIRTGEIISSEKIVQKNSDLLIETANILRAQLNEIVLEPATLHIPGWTQAEYIDLWEECIRKHAGAVRLMADWEYSAGCVTEFAFAKRHGVRTENIDGAELNSKEAVALLDAARRDIFPDRKNPRLRCLYEALEGALSDLTAPSHP